MDCPTDDGLNAYLARALPDEQAAQMAAHVAACAECDALLEILVAGAPDALAAGTPGPRGERPRGGAQVSAGDRLGRYVLQARIGAGGMGVVWAAYDTELDRTVAIKLVSGWDDESRAELRARVDREVRLTARLQHPAIVHIQEAGAWPSGEPFYVMKLVPGTSLELAIADRASLAERLGLLANLVAVVDALAYAHGEGVIHRDLKPQNILVGGFGETVVIDWGLARAVRAAAAAPAEPSAPTTADEAVSRTGAIAGTPHYMAPEQAAGAPVDERADVYALGAILYHVLAGGRPYADTAAADLLATVVARPPRSLARVAPEAPRDLVAIVARAMARSPTDRYPSARELADDLKRFQTGQLVGSHRYSLAERLARWLRRHRAVVAVAAVALTALVVLGGLGLRRILAERRRADAAHTLAEARRADTESLMDFMLFDLRTRLKAIGRLDLLRTVAEQGVAYYRDHPPLGPTDRYRQSTALTLLGDVRQAQGDDAGGLALQHQAMAIDEALVAEEPAEAKWQAALARDHQELSAAARRHGDLAGALTEERASLAILERVAARAPTDGQRAADLSLGRSRVGDLLFDQGQFADALALYRGALADADALVAREPREVRWRIARLERRVDLGTGLEGTRDLAGAERAYRTALAGAAEVTGPTADEVDWLLTLVRIHRKLGSVQFRRDPAASVSELEAAVAIERRLVDRDPSNDDRQGALASDLVNLGISQIGADQAAAARTTLEAALAILDRLGTRAPTNTDWQSLAESADVNLGDALRVADQLGPAITAYRAAAAKARALVAKDPSSETWRRDLSAALWGLAQALAHDHAPAEAGAVFREALDQAEAVLAQHPADPEWREAASSLREAIKTCCRGR